MTSSPDPQRLDYNPDPPPTYDIVAPLEAELGIPVLTANQVTMWACLRRIERVAVGPDQALVAA